MPDVAIVGAGELGGAIAHMIARRDVAGEIRLIDRTERVAAGKALDITQAAPIESFATRLSGSGDPSAAGGAAVIVLADPVGAAEWQGEEGLALLRRLARTAPAAILLCAGATQRELVERGVREGRIPRSKLIGSAPEAMAAAVRAMVALETNHSPRDVTLSVLGVPPDGLVVPWNDAAIGGFSATRLLDEPARRRVVARLTALWPPGPYALASAAAKVVDAAMGRSRRLSVCFVGPDDSAGRRVRAAALPVRLNAEGIEAVVLPALDGRDQVALENAMML